MQRKEITIINKLGLHARAAAKLVQTASSFNSDIQVIHNQKKVNGKSIMGVMMLAASKGTRIEIVADGEDEAAALAALEALILDRFGEGE
jgi:phosphocarrier protein